MKRQVPSLILCFMCMLGIHVKAQINLLQDYKNNYSANIGTFQNVKFRESGFSGMFPIAGTNGKEFWICSDRGVNIDAANANPSTCRPTYDKIFSFPSYAPKIHRIRLNGDSLQIIQTISIKRPSGTGATGVLNPDGFGSTSTEKASTDTVLNCANFNSKIAAKDIWGMDAEGLVVDKDGNFWICEENGPTIWKLNKNGVLIKRFTPYANLSGAQAQDVQIDEVFKYRKNNRGFEGIALAPNGKIYAIIQSPLLYPTQSVGESTRIHRILEIDPTNNSTKMYAYLNDGIIGASGSNQIRLKDWKIGDMAAINDSTFLVLEAASRGTSDYRRIYQININSATAVSSGLYGSSTLEGLADASGLATYGIVPVKKTLFMDLDANGWPSTLEKAEGLAIINDSTIAICNDNDYGQISIGENGIATATSVVGHVLKYGLKGSNKLQNLKYSGPVLFQGVSAQNSSQSPYILPAEAGSNYTAILTAGDNVNGYKMAGIPDGIGAFDNNNGTFTVLLNHELGNTSGITRAHGSTGAFISKWNINKSDLSVNSGEDLIKNVNLWNSGSSSYTQYGYSNPSTLARFNRFCSADLPASSAFYNEATGFGTQELIYLNGEEAGNEGRGFAHIASGTNAGTTWELPRLGKFSWENALANPATGNKTVVAGTDDATPGQIYFYIGTKTNSGNEIEKAGLTNGKLFGPVVSGMPNESSGSFASPGTTFTMADLGNVENITGATLESNSNSAGVTRFLRPEDGVWDPMHPSDFYFVTTNGFGSPSRLWKMHFSDLDDLTKGGTITAVLDGTEGQQMMDNIGIDNSGHIFIQEDVGNNSHNGKIWEYNIQTDSLKVVGIHDSTRFQNGGTNFLTQDEEASGIVDVQKILGPGWFILDDQAHYGISGEVVQGGQLLAFFNKSTFDANPEANATGNSNQILDGDITPSVSDYTDFGNVNPGENTNRTFVLENKGTGNLLVTKLEIIGTGSAAFSTPGLPSLPWNIAGGGSQSFTIQYAPVSITTSNAMVKITTNDIDEDVYNFAIKGNGVCTAYTTNISVSPEYPVAGQNQYTIYLGYGAQTVELAAAPVGSFAPFTYTWSNAATTSNTTVGPTSTTNYSVVVTNKYGCTSATSQTIYVMDVRDGNKDKLFICHNGHTSTVSINAIPTHLAHGDKLGTCDNNGPAPMKMDEATETFAHLFPNPASDMVSIEMHLESASTINISISDISGKMLEQKQMNATESGTLTYGISTSNLPNGIYFVSISNGILSEKIKLVVVH
ncbi:MAG: esterase-like activity of phytase family protein [Bacteroidetes bacterium]|nr:esterase-like activity of phytase family protein [Bacteroidota bacterium]